MFEKVNPMHPDKIADRIAGALVDIAYRKNQRSRCAVEVLLGHGYCTVIIESTEEFGVLQVDEVVKRIAGNVMTNLISVPQDPILSQNQEHGLRCGDNGIFKGMPLTNEQRTLSDAARKIFERYPYDGKYVLDEENNRFIICQSNAPKRALLAMFPGAEVNPLGDWTGGTNVDAGATNRKLGSDMADSVTGGGLHGKDVSKADVSVNIYAFLKAQKTGKPVTLCCAIGDDTVDGRPYSEIVDIAENFILDLGGFEKFAEWGLY